MQKHARSKFVFFRDLHTYFVHFSALLNLLDYLCFRLSFISKFTPQIFLLPVARFT